MTGPNIVAIGGGHGLASTLSAARSLTEELTAVVSVADDGGSSGRISESLGLPALGDLRKALVALSAPDSALAAAMHHRFTAGELGGHALGNLLIAAMAENGGDLVGSLDAVRDLLGATGRVLPGALEPVVLWGETADGESVKGQVAVMRTAGLAHVRLDRPDVPVPDAVPEAIDAADLVILGPGSLYTSVLAACAADDVREAVSATRAKVVYVCNLRPQQAETIDYGAADHVAALQRHGIEPDVVLIDPRGLPEGDAVPGARLTRLGADDHPGHDPGLLSAALADLV